MGTPRRDLPTTGQIYFICSAAFLPFVGSLIFILFIAPNHAGYDAEYRITKRPNKGQQKEPIAHQQKAERQRCKRGKGDFGRDLVDAVSGFISRLSLDPHIPEIIEQIKFRSKDGNEKIWKPSEKGAMRGDVWDFPTLAGKAFSKERTEHPSQKPEALITEIIKAFCPMDGDVFSGNILDPFLGSGTLGVCCEKLNKAGHNIQWTGIELEKKWCDIARKRLSEIQ